MRNHAAAHTLHKRGVRKCNERALYVMYDKINLFRRYFIARQPEPETRSRHPQKGTGQTRCRHQ